MLLFDIMYLFAGARSKTVSGNPTLDCTSLHGNFFATFLTVSRRCSRYIALHFGHSDKGSQHFNKLYSHKCCALCGYGANSSSYFSLLETIYNFVIKSLRVSVCLSVRGKVYFADFFLDILRSFIKLD